MKHTFHRVLVFVMIAVLALTLGVAAAAATPNGFNAQIGIDYPDENTMVVSIDAYSSDILAEHTPTLILPCTYTEAYVTYDGAVIASVLDTAAGEIRFTPAAGGSYTVHAGKDPTIHVHTPVTDQAVEPGCTEDGKTEGSHCDTCGEVLTAQETVPATGHDYVDGKCSVCGADDPDYVKPTIVFNDVAEGQFFYEPVLWAVENGITSGVGANRFAPDTDCTRGQVVTFLWRAAGKPAPTSTNHPFIDIKEGEYYYEAVLWAVENGITSGMTATEFQPNAACTRGQVVTFMWRAEGKPEPASTSHPFTDIKEDDYFYNAVLWAVENGITNGLSADSFGPGEICNRGQIVTFLYRGER